MRIQPLWEKQTIYQGATWQPYWAILDEDGVEWVDAMGTSVESS